MVKLETVNISIKYIFKTDVIGSHVYGIVK